MKLSIEESLRRLQRDYMYILGAKGMVYQEDYEHNLCTFYHDIDDFCYKVRKQFAEGL